MVDINSARGFKLFHFQLLSAVSVSFGAMCVGGWMSFSSVAIPKMMNGTIPGDPIQIDLHVGSWIASTFFIGNVVGCLVGGLINQVDRDDCLGAY